MPSNNEFVSGEFTIHGCFLRQLQWRRVQSGGVHVEADKHFFMVRYAGKWKRDGFFYFGRTGRPVSDGWPDDGQFNIPADNLDHVLPDYH
jgi:hypothetical protein